MTYGNVPISHNFTVCQDIPSFQRKGCSGEKSQPLANVIWQTNQQFDGKIYDYIQHPGHEYNQHDGYSGNFGNKSQCHFMDLCDCLKDADDNAYNQTRA